MLRIATRPQSARFASAGCGPNKKRKRSAHILHGLRSVFLSWMSRSHRGHQYAEPIRYVAAGICFASQKTKAAGKTNAAATVSLTRLRHFLGRVPSASLPTPAATSLRGHAPLTAHNRPKKLGALRTKRRCSGGAACSWLRLTASSKASWLTVRSQHTARRAQVASAIECLSSFRPKAKTCWADVQPGAGRVGPSAQTARLRKKAKRAGRRPAPGPRLTGCNVRPTCFCLSSPRRLAAPIKGQIPSAPQNTTGGALREFA